MGIFGDIGHFIMTPLYYAISFVLVGFHKALTTVPGLDPKGGTAWALAIIGLTLVIRATLIPLFVKQIKSSRNMQLIQPKVKELQKKYGHDRERLAQETMKLYKDSGTNPFAPCLQEGDRLGHLLLVVAGGGDLRDLAPRLRGEAA